MTTYQTEIPIYACEPLRNAVDFARNLTEEVSDNLEPGEFEAGQEIINSTLRTCARLCAEGCIRDAEFRLEAIGQQLPPDNEREAMFGFVSNVLTGAAMLSILETEEPQEESNVVGCSTLAGKDLKEIATRRLNTLSDPSLLENIASSNENKIYGENLTAEEFGELFADLITPIEDSAYDELAKFTRGNLHAALVLISYLQKTYPLYRSTDPEQAKKAEDLSEKGLKPANPYLIGPMDIMNLAKFVQNNGMMKLPTSFCSDTFMYFTDNPDDFLHYSVRNGEVIDIFSGHLPAIQKKHLPVVIETSARE